MPKEVIANGKKFTFDNNVSNEDIGDAIDEYFTNNPISQKKSPNESQEDGGGDLQTQSKQEQMPVVEKTSTLQTIKDNAMPIAFAGLSISFVILIVFLFLKFKTRMWLFFSNLFKSTTFKITCAVILGFLLFTNPSIKDFEEFYPSEHKSTRERACKEFDMVSRQTNLLLFSVYKVQNRYKDCNAFPNVYYLGIAKNFIFLNEEK
ncbi:MAG: hypothetical protein EAZ53_14340 [Bacteroidetes bacterium]|nr:MAG: hypothetical protein EAZ53_14340 [Bacteroidota bacterium]